MKCARTIRGLAGGALTLTLGLAAVAAPAAWASPSAKHVTYKFSASKVAWTGSSNVIAATDTHGDLDFFSEASGSTTWHGQTVAKARPGVSYSKPAIGWSGHAVYIAAVNQSGDLLYFVRSGGTWHGHVLAHGSPALHLRWQTPSIASIPGGGLLMTDGNAGGVLASWELASGASQWTESPVEFGNYGASSVATVQDESLGLAVAPASAGGSVYFWFKHLGVSIWKLETVASPGLQGSFGNSAITLTSQGSVVTAPTTAGSVGSWNQPIGAVGWTEQTVTDPTHPGGHVAIASFELHIRFVTTTYDVIAGTGPHGALDFWWDSGFGAFHPETIAKASKQAAYSAPSIAVSATSTIVTAVNTKNGNLMFWHQNIGATAWHAQLVAKG